MILQLRNNLVAAIQAHTGSLIIPQDSEGERPEGKHATYKITSTGGPAAGRETTLYIPGPDALVMQSEKEERLTISFTAYSFDADESFALAEQIREFFAFYGEDVLRANNAVVDELTEVDNRDEFLIDEYERKNGFDVIIRILREFQRSVDFFENVEGITN
jgi:hypothetical protein